MSNDLPKTQIKIVDFWMLFSLFLCFISILLHIFIESEGEKRKGNGNLQFAANKSMNVVRPTNAANSVVFEKTKAVKN